jgi:hypothetical protein
MQQDPIVWCVIIFNFYFHLACNCPSNTERKRAQVKPGGTKAFVSWLEPKPSCPTNSSADNLPSTSGWFSVGEHTLTYKYTPKTGKQQLECHVNITVTGM